MKKTILFLAGLLSVLAAPAFAANQGNPSCGVAAVCLTTQIPRKVPTDGNGNTWADSTNTLGYKVYESSASSSVALVKDEVGNVALSGVVHAVCVSGDASFGVVFDTNTTSGITASGGGAIGPQVKPLSSVQTCVVLDAQFNTGLAVVNGSAAGATYIYWRPSRGGSN